MSISPVLRWASLYLAASTARKIFTPQDPTTEKTSRIVSSRQHTHWMRSPESKPEHRPKELTVVFPIPNMKDPSRH